MWANSRQARYERGVAPGCPECFGAVTPGPACRREGLLLASRARLPGGPTLAVMVWDAQPPSQERVRGASLGLPAEGPGSLASFGTRVLAFLVDALASALVAGLF